MNIVHLEDERWDSGLAHYAVTLAAEQARRGQNVSVWGLENSPVLKDAAARGLATRGWRSGVLGWSQIPALRRDLARFKPDVVNAHTGSAHARALLIAPKGAAVVRTRGDARSPQKNILTRVTAARTAALIAANTTIKFQLESVFPGILAHFVPQGIEGPSETAPLPGVPRIGMIARLDPVKGHAVLIDAAMSLKSELPALKVSCAGEGRLLESLRSSLAARGLSQTVEFIGRVADKWSFLASCRIGVAASTGSEAVSRAALEWMAAGRPLIATKVGGLADLVEDGATGLLIPPGDPSALAAAVRSLVRDPARAERMGRAARTRWENKFSLAPFYAATQKVYDQAIDSLSR